MVVKLLLDCGMNVNAKNEAKSTALHVAVQPYNYSNRVSKTKIFLFSTAFENGKKVKKIMVG